MTREAEERERVQIVPGKKAVNMVSLVDLQILYDN